MHTYMCIDIDIQTQKRGGTSRHAGWMPTEQPMTGMTCTRCRTEDSFFDQPSLPPSSPLSPPPRLARADLSSSS